MQDDEIINDFSLREEINRIKLENILDELQEELNVDIKKFKTVFKNLPLLIYNKIDYLANTYSDNKNEDLKRISDKAKFLSKIFHNQFK